MKTWIAEGAGPTEENLGQFVFDTNPDRLTVYFSDYQVGDYASGPREANIPLDELRGVMGIELPNN